MRSSEQKVEASHLRRNAYLYVRQSTPRQVLENVESTERQYALRCQAAALGWPPEQIIVIDNDLGQSGASAADRAGFQRLVTEVSLGRAGMVLGLEVSRLARNCADWHRLLEICAVTDTLILDQDGLYNPAQFNDRLLLGLKGTMSEAELHMLQARLHGGSLNKAKRGELAMPLPIGLVYNAAQQVVLDPDQQVQQSVHLVFATFRRMGSAFAVVQAFRDQALLFPRRRRGETLSWRQLSYSLLIRILHNPRYAGAFVYGRSKSRRNLDGSGHSSTRVPMDQWPIVLRDVHPGYLSWEQFEANLSRLQHNTCAGQDNRKTPPREGPALLQGLALCGICGQHMHPRYHLRRGHLVPDYACPRKDSPTGLVHCQYIAGSGVDAAVGQLLIDAVAPVALEVALSVQREIQSRLEEADRLRQTHVERARYEANLAQRRYLQVDPANRLVADSLEADWNDKLRALAAVQQEYERQCQTDRYLLDDDQRSRIFALATDFRQLWQDPRTPDRERKRMARLLIEDVTLIKGAVITMHVRFKGGATKTITLALPLNAWQRRRTAPSTIAEIDRLLDWHVPDEIAKLLNQRHLLTADGKPFDAKTVAVIARLHGLPSRYDRLRAAGLLTISEMARRLKIADCIVWRWRKKGILHGQLYGVRKYLYEPPASVTQSNQRPCEVQYEA
jgi:DNA invertase Pin-like site-specific DNA recombinase